MKKFLCASVALALALSLFVPLYAVPSPTGPPQWIDDPGGPGIPPVVTLAPTPAPGVTSTPGTTAIPRVTQDPTLPTGVPGVTAGPGVTASPQVTPGPITPSTNPPDRPPTGDDWLILYEVPDDVKENVIKKIPESAKPGHNPNTEDMSHVVMEVVITNPDVELPITIRLIVEGITPGTEVIIILYTDESMTDFIILRGVAGAGYVDITFDGVQLDLLKNGYLVLSFPRPIKSPQTGADYSGIQIVIVACLAVIFLTTGYSIKVAKQR